MQDSDPTPATVGDAAKAESAPPARFRLDDLVVDTRAQTVHRGDESIALPQLSWQLLLALSRRWPAVASQDELIAEVWPETFVGEEVLTQRIKLLRQSLGDDSRNPRYIKTVRGAGYRLAVAVEAEGPAVVAVRSQRRRALRWLLAAAIAALAAAFVLSRPAAQEPGETAHGGEVAIAILPFDDLSSQAHSDHFSAALHEEVLSRLSRVGALRVSPRTSVLSLASERRSIREVAARLDVDAVVEGGVRRVGDRIMVSVRLLDGRDESLLWSDSYEREVSIENLLSIQSEIAERITRALQVELSVSERQTLARLPTASLEAYNLYLLGRYHVFQSTPGDLTKAIDFLDRALAIDPEFAEAWAALASAYSFLGTNYGLLRPAEANGAAKEAVLKALALDADLVDARSVYADVLAWYDWDWDAAERQYQRIVQQAPDLVLGYAFFLSAQGRHDESAELVERLLDRYPGDPWVQSNAAWRFLDARRFDRAIEEARLAGDHPDINAVLGWSHLGLGQSDAALGFFQRAAGESGRDPGALSRLAIGYAATGEEGEARKILADLLALFDERYFSPVLISQLYVFLGEPDDALSWLDRALELRTRDVIFLREDFAWDALRDDPRFLQRVEALGLPG